MLVILAVVYSTAIYPRLLESKASVGSSKEEVLSNFEGKDYRLVNAFNWCEQGAWYGDCDGLSSSDSVEFLMLKIGIDTWLVVGFDRAGKVAFVGRGDT